MKKLFKYILLTGVLILTQCPVMAEWSSVDKLADTKLGLGAGLGYHLQMDDTTALSGISINFAFDW